MTEDYSSYESVDEEEAEDEEEFGGGGGLGPDGGTGGEVESEQETEQGNRPRREVNERGYSPEMESMYE